MRLPEVARREQGEQVIPLINIVFLLLIFFMLAGTFSRPDVFPVEPPATRSGLQTDLPDEGVLLLAADGRLAFDGEELGPDRLALRVAEWLADNPDRRLRLKADGAVAAERLLAIMDVLRDAGAERLILLTNPAER